MNYVHNWTSPTTIKRKSTIPASMSFLPDHVSMPDMWSVSWAALKRRCCRGFSLQTRCSLTKTDDSQVQRAAVEHTWQSTRWKSKNGRLFLYLDELLNLKVSIQRSTQRVNSSLRQAFPEGFMPPWRIQHESHTCSETSLRILMWIASYVQKHFS